MNLIWTTIHRLLRACLAFGMLLAVSAAYAAEPDYEALGRDRVGRFFLGELRPADFAMSSGWRRNFQAANLADKASLRMAALDILEVRLPDNPSGLEVIFSLQADLPAPAHLDTGPLPAGRYTLAGSMSFYHTTNGYLVRDCSFTIIDKDGKVMGGNYLPWKLAVPRPGAKKP